MNDTTEKLMVAAHMRGREEYATQRHGIDEITPEVRARILYETEDEQIAYVAGYRGDHRRATKGGM